MNDVMKKTFALALIAAVAGSSSAFALEASSGSVNYEGVSARLEKAPVGSPVTYDVIQNGNHYRETYVVQSDRSLKLVDRAVRNDS
jgi:hypothetical protein